MLKLEPLALLLTIAGGACASQSGNDQDTIPTHATAQSDQDDQAQPTTQPPEGTPDLPTSIPPITSDQAGQFSSEDTQAADEDQGQWVYTQQYGWIWMPYSDDYIYTPDESTGGSPYAYVYYPTYGWTWLEAPWVWGLGADPFFSHSGFHHRFFREQERENFRGERFRGGFQQPPGFRVPAVSSRTHGQPMAIRGPTGGHVTSGPASGTARTGGGHMGGASLGGGHMGGGGGHMGGGGGHMGGGGGHR